MQAFLSPSPLHLSPSLPRTRCASHSHLRRLPRQRRPRASATPAPTPPPPPPPPPLARLPDALRGVNETAPFYVALAAAQTMPFVAPSRGTLVDVAYFGITAICALVIGCKRSPLQSAELQTPLTGRQVAVAPVAASVTLFGAYLILHYTPLDIGFVFNLMTTFIGGLCLKEALDPLMVSALRVAGVENRPVANIEEPETVEEEVPQVDLSDALSAATAAAVIVLYLIPPSLLPAAIGDLHFVFSNTIAIGIAARVLSLIRPDSFLAAAGLLCGLCLYDIFAVFLSPLFAPGGESVMVAVALKIDSPGKLLFPRDPASLASATSYPFAVLGLGDLIVPGVFMTLVCSTFICMRPIFALRESSFLSAACCF